MAMAQPPQPHRSQSTTSLAQFYNGTNGDGGPIDPELQDPRMDFCNAFWGQNDKGYDVLMARLRGANRTVDELRAFWKERASIEEDYAKRLAKLSKTHLGRDEIGDLALSLQNVLTETAAQASYHQSLGSEIRSSVEAPTTEFTVRLSNLKKGLQASIEKSYRNKGLQEGHVQKARERYEQDCLKMNGYTANQALTQGKEAEKLQGKVERVRQTIGQNEQDFRQFVKVLEGTCAKWENEWKNFCDHVQDLEEDRLALVKDIVWAYANAVSQVCVEDDSSCERIREKLETFEPQNDMVTFVRGWGTGDTIPDPPRFVNYSAGEYPMHPSSHMAQFRRLSARPPPSAVSHQVGDNRLSESQPEPELYQEEPKMNGISQGMQNMQMEEHPAEKSRAPFGGIAMPGMASPDTSTVDKLPKRQSSMPPPPVPPAMTMPEPRVPSRQGPPSPAPGVNDEDPMAKALAELRRDPPPPNSVRRNPSHRRPDSAMSTGARSAVASPPPINTNMNTNNHRMSMQANPQSPDMTLSPPAAGHTAAQLAKSMDEFQRQSNRDSKRQSTNYANFANDIVGGHPSSRPASPAGRGPSPVMMQPPTQPATHIADEVLSQYHQAFPGERGQTRSRAGSVASHRSGGSFVPAGVPPQSPGPSSLAHGANGPNGVPPPRQAFAGIGAGGGRSPSPHPQPPTFRTPSPSPTVPHGNLGPQNLGISLDASGGVAQDSMAEAYRRQYQASQQQPQQPQQQQPGYGGGYQSSAAAPGYTGAQSPMNGPGGGPPPVGNQRPTSQYGGRPTSQYSQHSGAHAQQQQPPPQQQQQPQQYSNTYQPPPPNLASRPSYSNSAAPPGSQGSHQQYQPPQQPQQQYSNTYAPPPPVQQQQQSQPGYGGYPQSPGAGAAPYGGHGRSPSPAPPQAQQAHNTNAYRAPSPAAQPPPQQQYGGYRSASPQPQTPQSQWQSQQQQQQQQQQHQVQRSPSPQPGVPPSHATPTGQWSTTGQPVLFYVKALYDYSAQSAAEFDFQSGDIIAVTATPEDGWWSGELLDEARRIHGRTDFPSNFVCLF